jgi:hypothetical protein
VLELPLNPERLRTIEDEALIASPFCPIQDKKKWRVRKKMIIKKNKCDRSIYIYVNKLVVLLWKKMKKMVDSST